VRCKVKLPSVKGWRDGAIFGSRFVNTGGAQLKVRMFRRPGEYEERTYILDNEQREQLIKDLGGRRCAKIRGCGWTGSGGSGREIHSASCPAYATEEVHNRG